MHGNHTSVEAIKLLFRSRFRQWVRQVLVVVVVVVAEVWLSAPEVNFVGIDALACILAALLGSNVALSSTF